MKCVFDHFDTDVDFEVPEGSFGIDQPETPPKLFRDPVALRVMERIASGLQQNGFQVTDPRPGKACPAACELPLKDRRIHIVLVIDRDSGRLNCHLLTFCSQSIIRSLLHLNMLNSLGLAETWMQLCGAIDQSLRKIDSIRNVQWHRIDSQPPGSLKLY